MRRTPFEEVREPRLRAAPLAHGLCGERRLHHFSAAMRFASCRARGVRPRLNVSVRQGRIALASGVASGASMLVFLHIGRCGTLRRLGAPQGARRCWGSQACGQLVMRGCCRRALDVRTWMSTASVDAKRAAGWQRKSVLKTEACGLETVLAVRLRRWWANSRGALLADAQVPMLVVEASNLRGETSRSVLRSLGTGSSAIHRMHTTECHSCLFGCPAAADAIAQYLRRPRIRAAVALEQQARGISMTGSRRGWG